MKKLFFLLTMVASVTFAIAQESKAVEVQGNLAKMEFETETLDYGKIENGSDGNREFKFKNTGTEPLIITSCKGSCGCTVPKCPKEPILPGEEGTIKVKYDTKRTGPFTKTITVQSNAGANKILKIKGTVNPAAPTTDAAKSGSTPKVD